jgi:hypothetical protein
MFTFLSLSIYHGLRIVFINYATAESRPNPPETPLLALVLKIAEGKFIRYKVGNRSPTLLNISNV